MQTRIALPNVFQGVVPRVDRERLIWICLVLAALIARFVRLDERGMSHDESLHALYSFYLAERGEYVHDPMMHGPLLFHLNAFVYRLTAHVSDYTARLAPALVGTLTVGSMWWYRRYLGRIGALAAAVLLLVSPSLLFYSRYIRNDIYVVFFAVCWFYTFFRYIESGSGRWMLGMGMAMVLGVASKENHFITGFTLGIFALVMGSWLSYRSKGADSPMAGRYWDAAVVMACLVLPFLAPVVLLVIKAVVIQMVVIQETLAVSPFVQMARDLQSVPATPEEHWFAGGVALGLALMALLSAYLWFERLRAPKWRGAFGFRQFAFVWVAFWITALLLFSTFLTNVGGMTSGVVGSLGYWLAQQEVQRGSQPWYYYIMLTSFYEYLPLLLSLWGGFVSLQTLGRWLRIVSRSAQEQSAQLPVVLQVALLLLWWSIASWLAYSFAGERMPWLLCHIAAPMCLLGAFGLSRLIAQARHSTPQWWIPIALLGTGLACAVALLVFEPFMGRSLQALRETLRWVTLLVGGFLSLLLGLQTLRRIGPYFMQAAVLSLALPLSILTARSSYQLNYVNFDYVTEYLVYAHAAPDVKVFLAELETLGEKTGAGQDLNLAYDSDNSWPLAWYFRDYPNAHVYSLPNSELMAWEYPAIVASASKDRRDMMQPYTNDYVRHTYRLIWWPEEGYKNWSWANLQALWDPAERHRYRELFFNREHSQYDLRFWPFQKEFDLYVRQELAPLIWDDATSLIMLSSSLPLSYCEERRGATPSITVDEFPSEPGAELELPLKDVLIGPYDGHPLLDPKSITVSDNGHRIVAEAGRHRILVLDGKNRLVRAMGSFCPLYVTDKSPCIDPDGNGPLALGDGQLHEPWGAAEAFNGDIVVADTWNHRIQVFDKEGRFKAKWGGFGQRPSKDRDGAWQLWGPRGVDMDPWSNPVVADTGNCRLVSYSLQGEWLATWDGEDTVHRHIREPVSVTRDRQSGHWYVTDSWNGRVQQLSQNFASTAEYPVPQSMWQSRSAIHKPYIALIPGRGMVATDPARGRLVFFDPMGEATGALALPDQDEEDEAMPLPLGIAVDSVAQELLVVDQGQNQILIYDLADYMELD